MSTQPPLAGPWAAPFAPPPRRPPRLARLWPPDPQPAAPLRAVAATAVALGTLGSLTLRPDAAGAAVAVTGTGVLAVALGARGRRPRPGEAVTAAAAVALLAVAAVRAAPWLVAWCLLGA